MSVGLSGRPELRNALSTAGNSMASSERPSPEPILKKEASPAILGGREFWKCSGSLKCLELQGLGHPSRTLEGNSRKRSESVSGLFLEFFRNFFWEVPAVLPIWGYGSRTWKSRKVLPRILPRAGFLSGHFGIFFSASGGRGQGQNTYSSGPKFPPV